MFWRQMVLDVSADMQRAGARTSTLGKTGTLSLLTAKLSGKEFRKVYVRLSLDVLYVFKAGNVRSPPSLVILRVPMCLCTRRRSSFLSTLCAWLS